MHLFRYTLTTLLFALSFTTVKAQSSGSVSGKLIDGQSKPVAYATVTLLRQDSSVVNGDLSKDDGTFKIAPVNAGAFLLRVESIGVQTKIISVAVTEDDINKKLGSIKLAQSENTLNTVSIVGEKAVMEMKVDKKVFNVEKNTTTVGGSATDVLQNVPSVSVDGEGGVSLRGKSNVTILIDGKPATMLGSDVASALQSLPAGSIESVEVITNPSAKYDAQGTTGIINIVTKKDGRFGLNGNITVGAGTRDKYNANFGLNVRKGKWSAFLNSSIRINNTYNNVITDRQDKMMDSLGIKHSYKTYEHVPRLFNGSFNTIGASYDFDKYNSITVTENVNIMQFGFKDTSDYTVFNNTDYTNPSLTQQRYSRFSGGPVSISSSIDYKRKFKKKDEELSIDATYAYTNVERMQMNKTYTGNDVIGEYAPGTGDNSTFNAWADYTDPLFTKNGKLGLGVKSQFYTFTSGNTPIKDSGAGRIGEDRALLSLYDYTQQIHAAYINWSDQVGKFSYQAGLRAEDAIYDGHGNTPNTADTNFHNSFLSFFPSAFVSYQLPHQQSIYLNYSRRTNRPGFMQLLPFVDKSNPGTVNQGNPGLIPEFIHNIEFSYNKSDNKGNNFILSAYYAYTQNLTERVTRPIKPDEAASFNVSPSSLYTRPVNIASGTTYGLEGTGHFQIIPIWDATVNANFFQNELTIGNDPELATLSNNSGFTWFGKINTNLKLPKNFSFQVNANYESPKIIAQGHLKETYWIDVALKKTFWKNKATLVLNCSDILKTHVFVNYYDLAYYSQTINRVKETRIGNISFTYRFGKADLGNKAGGAGKRDKKATDDKLKPVKPNDEDRGKNLKEGDGDDNNGGGGGAPGGGKGGNKAQ